MGMMFWGTLEKLLRPAAAGASAVVRLTEWGSKVLRS